MRFGVCRGCQGRQHALIVFTLLRQPRDKFSFPPSFFFLLSQFFFQYFHCHFFQFCSSFSAWARQCQRSICVQIIQMQSRKRPFEAKEESTSSQTRHGEEWEGSQYKSTDCYQCRIAPKNFVASAVVRLDKHVSNENLFCLFSSKTPCEPNCLRIPASTNQENFS